MSDSDQKAAPPGDGGKAPPPGAEPPPPDEFAHIPSRRARPPLVALGAVAFALFLGFRLRHDVSYAMSSASPRPVGDARLLTGAGGDSLINRFISIEGTPERESAVILDTQGSWKFTQLFRLRGTGGRVFVRRQGDPLPVALAERDRFSGRLLHFDELSFGKSIGHHFANRVTATHFFRPGDLGAALASGRPTVKDLAGELVTLAPGDRLHLDVLRPGEYRVELPRERFADRAKAQQAVQGTGARLLERQVADPRLRWAFEVAVPDADRQRVLAALGDLDRAALLREARDTREVPLSDLGSADKALTIRGPGAVQTLPYDLVASVRTRAPVSVPADALILLEGEEPRQAWRALVILAFLAAFAVVNLLGLRRPA